MLALVSFTHKPPAFPKARRDPRCPAALREEIWDLHSVLAHPASRPGESRRARERLLQILEEGRRSALPSLIVPPLATPPPPAFGSADGETDSDWGSPLPAFC
jgi:hypothetical protein